jgi:hypothetical protein
VATAYSATLQVTGGTPPYTWSLASGSSLPAGLSLSYGGLSSAGVISGTPATPGTSTFTVKVTDAAPTPVSDHKQFSITISGAAATCGSGNEAVLSGQYAFTLSGYNSTGFLALIGSFTADGSGGIATGEADSNGALGVQSANINASASSYSVGSDNRGCATIATSFGTFVARFALDAGAPATKGRIIEFDAPTSGAYIASGEIRKQDPTSFSGGLSGNYAFREAGVAATVGRVALSGVLPASGGSFSNGEEDYNAGGTTYHFTGMTGTYVSFDANGRGTATVVIPPVMVTNDFAAYMVSGSEIIIVSTDDPSTNFVAVGEMRKQNGTFGNGSVNGTAVFYVAGVNGSGAGSDVTIGTFTGDGSGNASVTAYDDFAGTLNSGTFPCTYSVAANGRVTLSGAQCGTGAPVLYLTAANTGFLLSMDSTVGSGDAEPQAGGPFSNASVSGRFFIGTDSVISQTMESEVGSVTLDGAGNVSSISDHTSTTGQTANDSSTDTYSVNSDGTFTVGSAGPSTLGIVISGNRLVMIDHPDSTEPSILVIRK